MTAPIVDANPFTIFRPAPLAPPYWHWYRYRAVPGELPAMPLHLMQQYRVRAEAQDECTEGGDDEVDHVYQIKFNSLAHGTQYGIECPMPAFFLVTYFLRSSIHTPHLQHSIPAPRVLRRFRFMGVDSMGLHTIRLAPPGNRPRRRRGPRTGCSRCTRSRGRPPSSCCE